MYTTKTIPVSKGLELVWKIPKQQKKSHLQEITIRATSGEWSETYRFESREFQEIMHLIGNKNFKELEALIMLMYNKRLLLYNTKTRDVFIKFIGKFLKGKYGDIKNISKSEDNEILEEERRTYGDNQ